MYQKGSPRFAVEAGLTPILIILLLAVAIGGYFIYQSQNLSVVPKDVPQSSPNSNRSVTLSYPSDVERINKVPKLGETSDWKLYKNTNFEIKYPNNWSLVENTKTLFENGETVTFSIVGKTQKQNTELYDAAYLAISKPIYMQKDLQSYLQERYGKEDVNGYLVEYSEEIINGISYQKVFSCGLGCFNRYFTKRGDNIFGFILYFSGPDREIHEQNLVNMLHTFKFTQ